MAADLGHLAQGQAGLVRGGEGGAAEAVRAHPLGSSNRSGWGVTYTARVRITVGQPGSALLIREGSGAGHGIDADLGQAHESALKEAETDAMKRALMTFGNPFGLALYDKQQRMVSSAAPAQGERTAPEMATRGSSATDSAPLQQQQPELEPLDPATIHQLCDTIRALPRPALEGFTKAFRKRFQVPPEVQTIADRICERRHHDWIEAFLMQHTGGRTPAMAAGAVAQAS